MSGFSLFAFAPFGGFYVVIGEAPAGSAQEYEFPKEALPEQMTPRMFFCDEFEYLGVRVAPGMMTQDLPTRPAGRHKMRPLAEGRSSYYLNSFRTKGFGFYGLPPVEVKRVSLAKGESYISEKKQAIMLAVGIITVAGPMTVRQYTAPAIIDCRFGAEAILASTKAELCEVWI